MVRRRNRPGGTQRRINSDTASSMLLLGHGEFRRRLISMSQGYKDVAVIVMQSEAYTSKTCNQCGALNATLGSKSMYIYICVTIVFMCLCVFKYFLT